MLIPAVFAQAAGNVFLSLRMKEVGSGDWLALIPRAVESPWLWAGTALLLLSFLLFAAALSWADLTFVLPAISVEVIVNVIFAKYFLGESISSARWAGALLISLGVILVVRSERRKARRNPPRAWTGESP